MARQHERQHGDPVVAAIERVLKTEREGMQQLQQSQEHVRQLLSQARAQADAIARRADACISRLHSAYLQRVRHDIDRLAQSNLSSGEHADNAHDRVMLVQVARRIAAKLTGGA